MKKILLVEDTEITRILYKAILEKFGIVDVAIDGMDAMNKFATASKLKKYYDIIFLDIMMPKYSGFQTLEWIRGYEKSNNNFRSKVVIISSLNQNKDINKAIDLGADGVLIKPIDYEIIKNFLQDNQII